MIGSCIDCGDPGLFRSCRCRECFVEVVEPFIWRLPTRGPAPVFEPLSEAPVASSEPVKTHTACKIDGCEKRRESRGWCAMHYTRWKTHGDPLVTLRPKRAPRSCEQCGTAFAPTFAGVRFCSRACVGRHQAQGWALKNESKTCIEPGCSNLPKKRGGGRLASRCAACYRKRYAEDPERVKARYRRKTYIRKAKTRYADFGAAEEREMRRKAKRCPLCGVRMIEKPYQPTSKELDHIIPLNVGGTHTLGNVRIICRRCNQGRPDDGSDYSGPVTLFAQEVA